MIESVVALLMFVNAEIKEARLQNSMFTLFKAMSSTCLLILSVVL